MRQANLGTQRLKKIKHLKHDLVISTTGVDILNLSRDLESKHNYDDERGDTTHENKVKMKCV